MKDLKIRASAIGKIMTENPNTKLTEKQLVTLDGLLSKIKLTEKQAQYRDALILKRDAKPELSKGAKSYIEELFIEKEYGIKQHINTKYIDKGNKVESHAIKLTELFMGGAILNKNEDYFDNGFVCGTPDVITDDYIIDVKSSWSAATFPFFIDKIPNINYEWQLKAYMWLTNIHRSWLCYCLVPTPEHLVNDEIRRVSWQRGELGDVSEEVESEVLQHHNIDKIPIEKRVKMYHITLTGDDIKNMKDKVTLARGYYRALKNKL